MFDEYFEEDYEPKTYYSECPKCGSDNLDYDTVQISDTVFKTTVYCNNCDFKEEFPEEEYDPKGGEEDSTDDE